jgi:hypothetical protein
MAKLFTSPDGADAQARAVLAYLSAKCGVEESWNAERHYYEDEPEFDRWHNCREQGYVVQYRHGGRQLNIAFFEHRNSDSICAVEWEQTTINPPTIDTFPKEHPYYESKWAVSKTVPFGQATEMADWIFVRLRAFWLVTEADVQKRVKSRAALEGQRQ